MSNKQKDKGEHLSLKNLHQLVEQRKNLFLPIVAGVVLVVIVYSTLETLVFTRSTEQVRKETTNEVIRLSTTGADQQALQNFAIAELQDGKNDDLVKSAIFWITHRFFDNGGNIYEIYDFINSHPEVAFLKDAEKIYPDAFQEIRDKKVTAYDVQSTLALLAYYESAQKHGYANISMLGLAANKYAELAHLFYQKAKLTKDAATKDKQQRTAFNLLGRSRNFSILINDFITKNATTTRTLADLKNIGLRDEDLLVGLNQYASAQYFYRGLKQQTVSLYPPETIFAFNVQFAREKVPRLYFFTNYLWAVGNVVAGTANVMTLARPLSNVIEYGKANKGSERAAGSLSRVLNANKDKEGSVFSHENAKVLAKGYPPFKVWLKENGWTDKDFK